MPRLSAGLLMYRIKDGAIQVLLAHPGGPYFVKKDDGAWSIPKGEPDAEEDLFLTAQREFEEETSLKADGPFVPLKPVKQKGGKIVHAWAFEGDCDPTMIHSNTFTMEWPPKTGQQMEFPEIDRAEFFDLDAARCKIKSGQVGLIDELEMISEQEMTLSPSVSVRTKGIRIMDVLYVVERDTAAFEAARTSVDIVCAGDSLTGWNNFGPTGQWPFRTYPDFLQELCAPLGLRIANGGIAGEISDNGPQQVRDYLELFPNARYVVIGMGTNDLGTWPDTEAASRRIIGNLDRMAQAVVERGKRPILFNVPHVNERMFPPRMAREVHGKRDFHNPRLEAFCGEHGIPLADICSVLHDEHFGDELHPNGRGAKIIAEAVFQLLPKE